MFSIGGRGCHIISKNSKICYASQVLPLLKKERPYLFTKFMFIIRTFYDIHEHHLCYDILPEFFYHDKKIFFFLFFFSTSKDESNTTTLPLLGSNLGYAIVGRCENHIFSSDKELKKWVRSSVRSYPTF